MALGDDLKGDVAVLLDDPDFGRDITISKTGPGSYDPTTGGVAAPVAATAKTRGLFLGYKDTVIDGTLIKQGDRKCIVKVQNLSLIPEVGDRVTVDDDVLTIISIKTVELGGIIVLYVLQVRR